MKIYLDFDGTVVEHQYPAIGLYNKGAFKVITKLQNAGHDIILNTYRADCKDGTLEEAIFYLNASNDILPIIKIEHKKIDPHPWDWAYFKANNLIFIDDICLNIPLKYPQNAAYKIVDWEKLNQEFIKNGIY